MRNKLYTHNFAYVSVSRLNSPSPREIGHQIQLIPKINSFQFENKHKAHFFPCQESKEYKFYLKKTACSARLPAFLRSLASSISRPRMDISSKSGLGIGGYWGSLRAMQLHLFRVSRVRFRRLLEKRGLVFGIFAQIWSFLFPI